MVAASFHPRDLKSVSDLRVLPILGRKDLQAQGQSRASTAPPFGSITKTTTGSTGEPLSITYDRGSEDWRQATRLRGYGWAGWHTGASTLHYWGVGRPLTDRFKAAKIALDRRLKRERYVDCGRRGDEDLAAVVETIRRHPPEVVIGFAQALVDLARHVVERGARDWPDLRVITAAEALFPADRALLVAAFGPRVFESYGSREVMLIAGECEAHGGMHVSMENLLIEVVVRDGSTERAAQPGETGELVVTDLHNYGMPFVRYALGDYATLADRKPCSCGRTLPRLASVDGRVTESFRASNGARVNGLLLGSIGLACGEKIRAFQIVQHRDMAVTFRIVPNGFDPAEEAMLVRDARKYVGDLPIRVERVADIPLPASGKRKIVVVE